MPRVRIIVDEYTLADRPKTYQRGAEIGVTDEEYENNKDKFEFLAPTTDRTIDAKTGQITEVVRKNSKP